MLLKHTPDEKNTKKAINVKSVAAWVLSKMDAVSSSWKRKWKTLKHRKDEFKRGITVARLRNCNQHCQVEQGKILEGAGNNAFEVILQNAYDLDKLSKKNADSKNAAAGGLLTAVNTVLQSCPIHETKMGPTKFKNKRLSGKKVSFKSTDFSAKDIVGMLADEKNRKSPKRIFCVLNLDYFATEEKKAWNDQVNPRSHTHTEKWEELRLSKRIEQADLRGQECWKVMGESDKKTNTNFQAPYEKIYQVYNPPKPESNAKRGFGLVFDASVDSDELFEFCDKVFFFADCQRLA